MVATTAVATASGGPAATSTGGKNIRMVDVAKRFGDQFAIRDLNLEIVDRELLVVLGPSGCGKSTTLNILAGLEMPTSGEIWFGSERVTQMPAEERNIAMVFQSIALYPNRNVQENILFALRMAKVPKQVQEQRLRDITHLLGIDRYLGRKIHQLSGGERQRVAIAKALVKRPSLFLLDEPFSNLDAEMRRELRGELVRIHRELETTMLFVTHDQEEAMAIADRLAVMNAGELVQLDTPVNVYERPATMWVARFVGLHRINLLEGALQQDNGQAYVQTRVARLPLEQHIYDRLRDGTTTEKVVLGIRPEAIHVTPHGTGDGAGANGYRHSLPASVYTRQTLGGEILYELSAEGQDLRALAGISHRYDIGQQVYLNFGWEHALWFEPATGRAIPVAH
jgi:multiple sugar transport system ATP-binding protein